MGRTKQLLEDDRHNNDHIYDAEYLEWVYYTQLPHITHKDNEGKQNTVG